MTWSGSNSTGSNLLATSWGERYGYYAMEHDSQTDQRIYVLTRIHACTGTHTRTDEIIAEERTATKSGHAKSVTFGRKL